MTDQAGGVVLERRGLSFGPRLTYLRALLSQSASSLTRTEELGARCEFYVELGSGVPTIRALGDDDWLELDDATLAVLSDTVEGGKLDLVLADTACIDLSFDVPPGLLPEVSQMIDAEILYRSPFAEDATLAIWEAHEASGGGWHVVAAVTLEAPVKALVAELKTRGVEIASVIRENRDGTLRTLPPWKRAAISEAPSPRAMFRSLNPVLQGMLAGAALFATSATVHLGQSILSDWSLTDQAAKAQTQLRQSANAATRLRGLDSSLAISTEVLALTGTLTDALPDNVWLDQIIIDGVEVTLVGFAPSAAEVTRILTDLPPLTDIRFASPVIRDNSQSIERFRIAAVIAEGSVR